MILDIKLNNFLIFTSKLDMSLEADMRIKKFNTNVFSDKNFNILKSICIFGANNSGKTCLIKVIKYIKEVMLGIKPKMPPNIYTKNKVHSFSISFLENKVKYTYEFKYKEDIGFIYEHLSMLCVKGNKLKKDIFIKDAEHKIYKFYEDPMLSNILDTLSLDNILVHMINAERFSVIKKYMYIFKNFASKIEIIDMNNIDLRKVITILKYNEPLAKEVVQLIKLSDLGIDDFVYDKNTVDNFSSDISRLISVHKGLSLKSAIFDSMGSKKLIALSGYIISGIVNGETLVIDDMGVNLHPKITRAIVSLFNNEVNKKGQLIFTTHDVTLLDHKRLFRKDQILFVAKDKRRSHLYSLKDFTDKDDGIKSDSNLIDMYSRGILGAVPEPDLIKVLLDIKKYVKG